MKNWADTIKISAKDTKGRFTEVASEADVVEKGEGNDAWWTLSGWQQETTAIKVEVYRRSGTRVSGGTVYTAIRSFQAIAVQGGAGIEGKSLSEQEIMELAVDRMIPDNNNILSYAKKAIKEEIIANICYS